MIRTIGMVNSSTKPALSNTPPDSFRASPMARVLIRWMKKVAITTITRMPPGRYSGCTPALTPASPRMFEKDTPMLTKKSFTGATVRLITRIAPISTYGSQARTPLMGWAAMSSSFISSLPTHSAGQSSRPAKSQVFFGIRKPFLAANVTIARPIRPPSNDGNSGPSSIPVIT